MVREIFVAVLTALGVILVLAAFQRSSAGGCSDSPSGYYRKVTATPEDEAHAARNFEKRKVPGKGWGVVARRRVPKWTLVGPYPGWVCTETHHELMKGRGVADDEYAVEFWKSEPGGPIDEKHIINPRFRGRMSSEFGRCVAPFVNEPDTRKRPNLAWVWNFPRRRVEMWTARAIKKGEELTICYGQYYHRPYNTKCQRKGVELARRAIGTAGQRRPLHWYDVAPEDIDPRPKTAA